jgi:hypothetical protein
MSSSEKKIDGAALFSFHDFDTFCPMEPLLPAKSAR